MKHLASLRWLCAIAISGCLQAPTPAADATLSANAAQAFDGHGNPTAADACVRQPTFELITNVPLAMLAPPIFLIDGELDAATLDDFSDPPLRAATQTRVIETAIVLDHTVARIDPRPVLAPGQRVTLVVAPWAVGIDGERWAIDDTPFTATFRVTTEADGGAAIIASWPADGAAGVPPNLAFMAIGFDGEIAPSPDTLTLSAEEGDDRVAARIDPVACDAVGLLAHRCLRLSPHRALQPATGYAIAITDWLDHRGGTIEAWSARFVTAAEDDVAAPMPASLPCALDETRVVIGCALIADTKITFRIATDEPALITWTSSACAPHTLAALGAEASIAIEASPGTSVTIRFDLTDAAGNTTRIDDTIVTEPTLPALTITETRFDPIGPEPQQEYVELFNFGDVPLDLHGYSLTDDRFDDGDVINRDVIVHPGGRVLLVADDFDGLDARDVIPAPGALIVRVGASIANGGLSNSGEALFLRSPLGVRISETPSAASAGPGTCLQRIDPHARDGSIGAFVHDAEHACTPGR